MTGSELRIQGRGAGASMSMPRAAVFVGVLSLAGAGAGAADAAGEPAASLALPAAAGQQAIAVRVEAGGLVARVCAGAPCAADGGKALEVPAEVAPLLGGARMSAIVLADGKHLARIDVARGERKDAPGGAGRAGQGAEGGAWVMLVAAPLAGKGTEPVVVWSGSTGLARGEIGEAHAGAIVEEPQGAGRRVLVGQIRDEVTICGRPTLVAAREVDPATLTLTKGASVQNLTAEERGRAVKLKAERREGEVTATGFRLLRATAASSAVGKRFAEIADGDPKTGWSEARAGVGRGEFVSFSSASEVGITGFGLRIKPLEDVPGGAAPRTLYVATPDRLFEVGLPEDAWLKEGAGYEVRLPEAVSASCVAVVLDDAYAPRGVADPRITIAEITARTAFDGQGVEALVGALAGGGERATAAAAVLARSGSEAVTAAIAGYEKLDDAGKLLAAGVIDTAPCAVHIPFFAARLAAGAGAEAGAAARAGAGAATGAGAGAGAGARLGSRRAEVRAALDPELHHARDRIRRCGRAAAPALAAIVLSGADAARIAAAWELALVAPAEAVPVLVDALGKVGDATRRELRAALEKAALNERAARAVEAEVQLDRLRARPEIAQIDLLRALGPVLGRVPGGAAAFRALASPTGSGAGAGAVEGGDRAPFRARYLLQGPAAALARAGDAPAGAYLRASLRTDADPHVRAAAASAAASVPALAPDLLAAVADPEVRVREAAIAALSRVVAAGTPVPAGATAALSVRLSSDPWTFIRAGAARALGAMLAAPPVDLALAAALKDASIAVREEGLDALGAHRARAHLEAVRDRAEDKEELPRVRARAILALAAMCDASSVALWTRLAERAKVPADERDDLLGSAAIAALGAVHPADLAARLAPLLAKDAPVIVREKARAALGATGQCR